MIIVELTYKKLLSKIEQHLEGHRNFLQQQYAKGHLLASGPKEPRDGGVMIALTDKITAQEMRFPLYHGTQCWLIP